MTPAPVQRRLAAILAADVVGYSRLMREDEEGTFASLTAHRTEVIEPLIAAHRGRIFKTTGDGALAEFASVVDAMRCAMAIQDGMRQRNAAVTVDRRIELRIGINLGDVIVQGHDVFGDGVNVAARLEGLAEPGGVCVSEAVYQQARHQLKLGFEDLGPTQVKNIAEPVRPFRVIIDGAAPPSTQDKLRGAPHLPDKPSIAVLPFANLSSDPEQEYFSDGITEDVITDLSKISGLFVIARNSTFVYKGKAINVPEVGRELGVRYVLEGSVRKAGGRVRVTGQLIDATTGGHVWAERYDRDLNDIFAVQDEVTQKTVASLALHLRPGERERIFERGTANFEAYDLFLRGRELALLHSRVEGRMGQELLGRAIELDPGFGKAYAFLGFAHCHEFINSWVSDPATAIREARACAEKAVALAPQDSECHWALGVVLMWQGEHERAIEEARTCLTLEPNSALGHISLGLILTYAGSPREALEPLEAALRLDPHYPDLYLYFLAQAQFGVGNFAAAESLLRQRIARNPNSDTTYVLLASTYGHLGRAEDARAAWREALRINPDYSLEHRRRILPYKNQGDLDRMIDGLRAAGLPV
ncbi:MAG: adenylate/guanylate cyclase domain-containing protein [Alphaproteobacteria bacterium]|nr:adenylate/guanylate cyclase domain-containing protein [Alphaproteobacteria bacterium]